MPLYTVGHSNRSTEDFIALLQEHGIEQIIDIRAIPYSGYNPQFNRDTIEADLHRAGIAYSHNSILAGDPPDRETMKRAVRCSDRSHNYAEYIDGPAPSGELRRLVEDFTKHGRVALMCGEKRPDHCHRYVTASRLEKLGLEVNHIIDAGQIDPHQPTLF